MDAGMLRMMLMLMILYHRLHLTSASSRIFCSHEFAAAVFRACIRSDRSLDALTSTIRGNSIS